MQKISISARKKVFCFLLFYYQTCKKKNNVHCTAKIKSREFNIKATHIEFKYTHREKKTLELYKNKM